MKSSEPWIGEIPAAHSPGRPDGVARKKAEQFRTTAKIIAATYFDSTVSPQITSTDLLATIGRAADHARAAAGRRVTLLLMSDMLNATGELNMERAGGVPNERWATERKTDGRLPELRGVCVAVAGADVSSKRGAQVRRFWQAYFSAAGATMPAANYRNMISSADQIGCGAGHTR
jgi:hypothetical protein